MTTTTDRVDSPAVRRRSVVQAAWAAPIVVAAVAAPAAVASAPAAPDLYVIFNGSGTTGVIFVEIRAADGSPVQTQFALEGKPRGSTSWVPLFRPSTRADGTFSSNIPSSLSADYSALRVTTLLPGYPLLISQEQPLPFS
ncbi:hypothetical protein [Rathayibacter sp. VKM Ac-2857]|uniref:hypothetical protein n=1 Tax=Rathayibacter sp. VKM Ac-2857 TaxID=2739020 RepID=UPI001564FAB0|nr:hypothetical protein [Rathayibacter sp. VKM Ac-2857]NQX18283.1 hypothetical protein [Rathayibacter sp. VKM Ac-2857]